MVFYLKTTLPEQQARSFIIILKYFRLAFNLSLHEARNIEGAHCMGNDALSDEKLESILRPLILERISTSREKNGNA